MKDIMYAFLIIGALIGSLSYFTMSYVPDIEYGDIIIDDNNEVMLETCGRKYAIVYHIERPAHRYLISEDKAWYLMEESVLPLWLMKFQLDLTKEHDEFERQSLR